MPVAGESVLCRAWLSQQVSRTALVMVRLSLLFRYLRLYACLCTLGTCQETYDSVYKWLWPACDSRYLENNVIKLNPGEKPPAPLVSSCQTSPMSIVGFVPIAPRTLVCFEGNVREVPDVQCTVNYHYKALSA